LPIIIISILAFKFITVPGSFSPIIALLQPFIWAFSIAYLLNPLMCRIEEKFKLKRIWNILIVYAILIFFITLIITIFAPKIGIGLRNIYKEIPKYVEATENYINTHTLNFGILDRFGVTDYLNENLSNVINQITTSLNPVLNKSIAQLINITSAITNILINFVIGLIISVYMLMDKEIFKKQSKALMYAMFKPERAKKIIAIGRECNMQFSSFLIGKMIDSAIIGVLCFIGLSMLRTPYALILSTIVGISNMIPYFGPFIGMIPATVITLFYSPIKALWVLIFMFLLQQFDGLYLGPKILGMHVGLRPFWIITSVTIGGGIGGVMGMLLAVPITAVLRTMIQRFIDAKLAEKNIEV